MLRRLELENFKSWEKLEIDLKPITLLFGANSSGKTALLDSLLMLKQTAESNDRGQSIRFPEPYVDLGSYHDLIYGHEDNRPLSVQLEWTPQQPVIFRLPATGGAVGNPDVRYEAQWRLDGDVDLHHLAFSVPDFRISLDRKSNGFYAATVTDAEKPVTLRDDVSAPESCYGLPRVLSQILPYDFTMFSHRFEMMLDDIRHVGPLRQLPERVYQWSGDRPGSITKNGSSTVDVLLSDDRRAVAAVVGEEWGIVDQTGLWLQRLGMAGRFSVTPIDAAKRYYEVRLSVPGAEDIEATLPDVGFGVSQLLPVIVQMLFAPHGSTLLFEQPEIHLHPRAAAELADLFLQIAEQRDLQLIIETHSEYLLSRLQRRIAEAQTPLANPDSIAIYFCELRDGASRLQPIQLNQYGQIENWPTDFFGDSIGDLRAMTEAMLRRKSQGG